METRWKVKNLEVGRGRALELADRIQHEPGRPVFNRITTLRDSFPK